MILKYEYRGTSGDSWNFHSANFGKINLLVGTSGSGKTRFLNVLFNMAMSISKGSPFSSGAWLVEIFVDDVTYEWNISVDNAGSSDNFITSETLVSKTKEGQVHNIISRDKDNFLFLDHKLPRLQKDIPGISLLKEEPLVLPVFNTFTHMKRRLFHESGLKDALAFENLPIQQLEAIQKSHSVEMIWKSEHTVGTIMFLLKQEFPELYNIATKTYMDIFPFIHECDARIIRDPRMPIVPNALIPTFVIKERNSDKWIQLSELSSGMQKVLLIISDILTLPKGATYIIDEYENSLGINAIDFLPDFLTNYSKADSQFFITTHHPYLINNMPLNNWKIFHREGLSVTIRDGADFIDRYGKSKQKAFIQLMNDPFYTGEEI